MSEEFRNTRLNTATSKNGFTVEVKGRSGILYRDDNGEMMVGSELLFDPFRLLVYDSSYPLKDLMEERRASILSNVVRACEFLGHRVELWRNGELQPGEFHKSADGFAASKRGFTVEVRQPGGISYYDTNGKTAIDAEWMVDPLRITIRGIAISLTDERREIMLSDVARACEFLGYEVKVL